MKSFDLAFAISVWSFKSKYSERRDQENGENGREHHHSRVPQEALQNASQINVGCDSIKGGSH